MTFKILSAAVAASLALSAVPGLAKERRVARAVEAPAYQSYDVLRADLRGVRRAYTSSGSQNAGDAAIGASDYSGSLHLFGARTDNAPY